LNRAHTPFKHFRTLVEDITKVSLKNIHWSLNLSSTHTDTHRVSIQKYVIVEMTISGLPKSSKGGEIEEVMSAEPTNKDR
jgi:hypothetical protein